MGNKININIAVDSIKALSFQSLKESIYMMDNSWYGSVDQGTENLCTFCCPGQTIHWVLYPIDLQTPAVIKNISFLSLDGKPTGQIGDFPIDNLDLKTWEGVLPNMVLGRKYYYRLELQIGKGKNSVMFIDTPSIVWEY